MVSFLITMKYVLCGVYFLISEIHNFMQSNNSLWSATVQFTSGPYQEDHSVVDFQHFYYCDAKSATFMGCMGFLRTHQSYKVYTFFICPGYPILEVVESIIVITEQKADKYSVQSIAKQTHRQTHSHPEAI